MNQLLRRLERVETDLLAERHARVDDLALLVDLVSSGGAASTSGSPASRRASRSRSAARPCTASASTGQGRLLPTSRPARSPPEIPAEALRAAAEHEHEPAAEARLAAHFDAAAERHGELARNRETESRARRRARPERAEDPFALLGGDPGPLSATTTETLSPSIATDSSTRPPSGVQRNAFESRFEMICSTRSPSVTITGPRGRRGGSPSRGAARPQRTR